MKKTKIIERNIASSISNISQKDEKMIFIYGPRQIGKTTLSFQISGPSKNTAYFNWDDIDFKRIWTKRPKDILAKEPRSLILDEIHKAKKWKSTLKGIWDTLDSYVQIIVTGSAKLNVLRKAGDSLMGRYWGFLLHPFSVGELTSDKIIDPAKLVKAILNTDYNEAANKETFKDMLEYGGFPEPFLKSSKSFLIRWQRGRLEKLIREDLRDLSRLPELSQVEMLCAIMPEKVGSPFSISSLREDMEVSFPTLKRWLNYLEMVYFHYNIKPYTKNVKRSIKKEGKIYLWDWSPLKSPGAKLENIIAAHLYKAVNIWNDFGMGNFELKLIRDKEKREVNFIIINEKKPWLLIEVKSEDRSISKNLIHFHNSLKPKLSLQLTTHPKYMKKANHIKNMFCMTAWNFLELLP